MNSDQAWLEGPGRDRARHAYPASQLWLRGESLLVSEACSPQRTIRNLQ